MRQVCCNKLGAGEVRIAQLGSREILVGKIPAGHVQAGQVDPREVPVEIIDGTVQLGLRQTRVTEISSADLRVDEGCPSDIGMGKGGTTEVLVLEIAVDEREPLETGARKVVVDIAGGAVELREGKI